MGNVGIEVSLSANDDLNYIMSLVRQSFDLQMGNGSDD
jgi:predicted transport protein